MNKVAARVIAGIVGVGILVLLVLFARPQATNQAATLRFALVPKSIGHPYWEGVRAGMLAAADRLGVKADFQGPPEASIEEQLKIIESLIAQGYNGIGISPNDPDAVKEIIHRAMAKGVAIVTFDSDSPDSERLMYIGTDNRGAGRVGGQALLKTLGLADGGTTAPSGPALVQVFGGKPGDGRRADVIDPQG